MALRMPPRKIAVGKKPVQVAARTTTSAPSSSTGGFGKARALNEEFERRKQLAKDRPIEFHMKPGEGGVKGVTVIITDTVRKPALPYFHFMHRWGFEKNDPKSEVCIQDGPEGCPLCRSLNRKGGFEMVLSCIDTRPFTYRNGPNAGKTVPRSRKPYVVKTTMIPVWERLYEKYKTYRGMVVTLHRDNGKAAGSGSSVEFVRMLSEAELAKYGDLSKPLDYNKAYPRLSAAKLAEIYGVDAGGAVGSEDIGGGKMASEDELPF